MIKKTFRIPSGILFFLFLSVIMVSFIATRTMEFHRSPGTIVQPQLDQPSATTIDMYSEFAVHEDTLDHEAANLMQNQGIKGYIVWTEGIGANPYDYSGRDYNSNTVNFGHKAIVRLNYGYGSDGTIPYTYQYDDFAQRCANFVSNSTGCSIWIIGNEMNNPCEWPGGTPIQPTDYATCFNKCYTKIKQVQPSAVVMPGAIDGYNGVWGDPRTYANVVYSNLSNYDAICVHSYTHGPDISLISADTYFGSAPLLGVHFDFKNFEDILAALPVGSSQKDVYITETNHLTLEVAPSGTHGWVDQNIGWIQTMYDYVRNISPYKHRIRCAALYRWPNVDAWVITGKSNLIQDFTQAMQAYINRGYPRVQYGRTYWVIYNNGTLTEAQVLSVATSAFYEKRTLGYSFDDAGIGDLDVRNVVVWGLPTYYVNTYLNWFQTYYGGVTLWFRSLPYQPYYYWGPYYTSAPSSGRGQPRVNYSREYWVLDGATATLNEFTNFAVQAFYGNKQTVGFSFDDAGIGNLDNRKAVIRKLGGYTQQSLIDFYNFYYPGVTVEFW